VETPWLLGITVIDNAFGVGVGWCTELDQDVAEKCLAEEREARDQE